MGGKTSWRSHTSLACAISSLFLATGCASLSAPYELAQLGIEYKLQELQEPRPNRTHVLRVDLAEAKVRPAVILADDPDGDGPAEAALTDPVKLAEKGQMLVAFINTNPWDSFPDGNGKTNRNWHEGQHVDIRGLAAAGGRLRSPAQNGFPSLWIDDQGRAIVGNGKSASSVAEGAAGFQIIVRDGTIVPKPGGQLHPRTSIGVDEDGSVLFLVVVDGRQRKFSEGMSVHELARLMVDLGCRNALNMDGGGSSIMGLLDEKGKLRVVNSPSDRNLAAMPSIRPLPMILTLEKREN